MSRGSKERRELLEVSKAKKAAGIQQAGYTRPRMAEEGFLRQAEMEKPEDTRTLTQRFFGDPIADDPRTPWRGKRT